MPEGKLTLFKVISEVVADKISSLDLQFMNLTLFKTTLLDEKKIALAIKKGFECRKASEDLCKRCGYAKRWSLDQ